MSSQEYETPEQFWESLSLHEQIIWAAQAMESEGLEMVMHAIQKPWNYKDEVFQHWVEMKEEEEVMRSWR